MKSTAVFAKKKSREKMVFYNHHHHLLIYSRALDPPRKKAWWAFFTRLHRRSDLSCSGLLMLLAQGKDASLFIIRVWLVGWWASKEHQQ